MVNERENLLRFYRHEPMDQFTTFFQGARFLFEASGYLERPPYHKSGKDWFGVPWIFDEKQIAFVPNHREKPILEDICDWREVVPWPDLDSIDWEAAAKLDGADKADRENFVYCVWDGCGPFERLHSLMGFEGALMAMVEEPEEVKAFLERFTEYKTKLLKYLCIYYKPDVIQFQDDAGTNRGTFYSPATWRELIKPVWQAEIDAIHSCGVYAELHSCGNNTEILVEMADTGLDSLFIQPLNDLQRIREACGGKIGLNVQTKSLAYGVMLSSGTVTLDQIYEMTVQDIRANLEGGNGYDYIPMVTPPVSDIQGIGKKSTALSSTVWDAIYSHVDEWNEIIKRKQAQT